MSETQQLSYDEPWPMYQDEDQDPWKDLERLLKLNEKMDTQQEIGEALGCTPSTISYWLDKARDEVDPDYDDEELHCHYHEVCGNLAPEIENSLCTVCLDLARHNQSEHPNWIDPVDFESRGDHMAALYDEYSNLKAEQQAAYDEWHDEEDGEDSKKES